MTHNSLSRYHAVSFVIHFYDLFARNIAFERNKEKLKMDEKDDLILDLHFEKKSRYTLCLFFA